MGVLTVLTLVPTLAISGCAPDGPAPTWPPATSPAATSTPTAGSPDATPSPTPTSDPAALTRARRQSAQYDYDGALTTLDGTSGTEADALRKQVRKARGDTREVDVTAVPHLFFHSLIVRPERAFTSRSAQGFDDYMVTQHEFEAMIGQMHRRGWVLVSPHDLAAPDASGRMRPKVLRLPRDRKPVILSVDDVDYYEYMAGSGFASNLTVSDGRLRSTCPTAGGRTTIGACDVAPVVDDFVEHHPDFAYHGHKGIQATTGYNGVWGYRTSERVYGPHDPKSHRNPHLEADRKRAKEVSTALRADGWDIASHSWGHRDMGTISMTDFTWDTQMWTKEVRPLTGPTDLFIYPFGADIADRSQYSGARYRLFREHGFRYFFNVDGSPHWTQLEPGYLRQGRINVDGLRLRQNLRGEDTLLDPFFDTASVFDPQRPEHRPGS